MAEVGVTFLGTGGGPLVVSKQIRSSGGIIVKAGGLQFHIDPGPGALVMGKFYGENLRSNSVILVSHNHLAHSNDVNAVISAMTNAGRDKKGILIASKEFVEQGLNQHFSDKLNNKITAEAGKSTEVGNTKIIFTKTEHSEKTGIGFKLLTPEFNLSYVGDTKYFNELPELHKDADILILNVLALKHSQTNLSVVDVEKILTKIKPALVILTHFSAELIDADPLYVARELQNKHEVQVIAARDGMTINPSSYSAQLKQKTLNLY